MKKDTLEQFMKRRLKRTASITKRQLNREHIKSAIITYLEGLPVFQRQEIIDIEIPALTTELVDIEIYTKE